ncbi:MAG: HypC/HybG/HupF family hydrogenase formation chaperone [Lachnospiraceae bacterium]|nr:HypC/HybG/HupF family hydrogenase formation chaperone [Lachnospiraceae bacterium]
MCLAVPLKITSIDGMDAVAERDGVRRKIRVDLLKEPKIGEYVMVHAGFAIERLNEEQARLNLEAAKEVEDALRELYS